MTVQTVTLHRREVALETRQDELPAGIAGRITGVALTYEQVDT